MAENFISKICRTCYQRIDCEIIPPSDDWCVYYKADQKTKIDDGDLKHITDTIEMSRDEIKSLIKKLK